MSRESVRRSSVPEQDSCHCGEKIRVWHRYQQNPVTRAGRAICGIRSAAGTDALSSEFEHWCDTNETQRLGFGGASVRALCRVCCCCESRWAAVISPSAGAYFTTRHSNPAEDKSTRDSGMFHFSLIQSESVTSPKQLRFCRWLLSTPNW